MTWLLLILYVNGAGHSPARFIQTRGSVTLLCAPQQRSRRHG